MKMWNDPNPHRRLRNRLILLYVALTFGLGILCGVVYVITDVAGIPNDWVRFLAYPAGFLVPLLPLFVIWMLFLTHRAKKWEKDPRAQGRPPFENARKRDAKEARLVEEEYSRETGESRLTAESPVEKEYGLETGERWVTMLAGTVEEPFESRVDLARREDGWVVRETLAANPMPLERGSNTTSHRLAKDYFTDHSLEDFLAMLSLWFPKWSFDGVRENPAVQALFAGEEPEPTSRNGLEWIERFCSKIQKSELRLVDLVRVCGEYIVRVGILIRTADGAIGIYRYNPLNVYYLRQCTVEKLIRNALADNDPLRISNYSVGIEEVQRLRESPRLRAMFEEARSVSSDAFYREFTLCLRGVNEQTTLPLRMDLIKHASRWTFGEALYSFGANVLVLPSNCIAPEALPRTLERVSAVFSDFRKESDRAALAAALSLLAGADGRVEELFSSNSEAGSGAVEERLDLYRDASERLFLRRMSLSDERIPSERIDVLPLSEDYFRTHAMEGFIETARQLCPTIDAEALRRNPALQALFENSQSNPAPQPEP